MSRENRSPPRSDSDVACDHEEAGSTDAPLRCACGSMLARYVSGGVELKCRRCKRTMIVPVEGEREEGATG